MNIYRQYQHIGFVSNFSYQTEKNMTMTSCHHMYQGGHRNWQIKRESNEKIDVDLGTKIYFILIYVTAN